jgi:hypothetical protein
LADGRTWALVESIAAEEGTIFFLFLVRRRRKEGKEFFLTNKKGFYSRFSSPSGFLPSFFFLFFFFEEERRGEGIWGWVSGFSVSLHAGVNMIREQLNGEPVHVFLFLFFEQ